MCNELTWRYVKTWNFAEKINKRTIREAWLSLTSLVQIVVHCYNQPAARLLEVDLPKYCSAVRENLSLSPDIISVTSPNFIKNYNILSALQ